MPALKMIHGAVNTHYPPYKPIEKPNRQQPLEKPDKPYTPWHTQENPLVFNGTDNTPGDLFRIQNGHYRLYAVKHAGVDVVRGNRGNAHLLLQLFHFEPHTIRPANNRPFACRVHRHPGVGNKPCRRCNIADMPAVLGHHSRQKFQCNQHGRKGIHGHGLLHLPCGMLMKILSHHNAGIVDQYIHHSVLAFYPCRCFFYHFCVGYIHTIPVYFPGFTQCGHRFVHRFAVNILDDQVGAPLQNKLPHYFADAGGTPGNQYFLILQIIHGDWEINDGVQR